jgi:hypothetical protein
VKTDGQRRPFSLLKKVADHLRRMILEYCWQVEMALQGAISFS